MNSTIAPTAVAIAFRAQRELQSLTHPDFTADTRQSTIEEYRRAFADAVAEAETGATRAEVTMLTRYPRSAVSTTLVARATDYGIVYRRTLDEIPTDMAGALEFFETACGIRRPIAA